MAELFGTDGIRGVANEYPITAEVAVRMGRAIARTLRPEDGGQKVIIGRDTRVSGLMLEMAMASGLVSEGVEVLLAGAVPTPAVALLTVQLSCDAGVMLTASHNPFYDNGIKVFGPDGYKLTDELEGEIEGLILSEELELVACPVGSVRQLTDAGRRYINHAKTALGDDRLEGLKVVLDCAHGAGSSVGPLVFEELGAEVIELGTSPDGMNINEGYGSLYPEKAAKLVRSEEADLGVCLDGDADRVIFIDDEGEVVSGDRVLCLCAKALKAEGRLREDTLVSTVMSNLGLRDALGEDGIRLEQTQVGDRHVLERMREGGFSLGGENSGHLIFADFATTGDGIVSALVVLTMLKATGRSLKELADCMDEYPSELVALAVREKPPLESVPEIAQAIAKAEEVLGAEGRLLVRYSGTEKKLRVLVEAKDSDLAKSQCEAIVAAAKSTIA